MADGVEVAADVAGIAELGDQLQGDLLPAAANPEGRVGLADTLRLVDGAVDGVVPALEGRAILRPHAVDDLDRLAEHTHPLRHVGEAVAVGPPLVLVPAGADAGVEAAVAGDVHGGGDLGEEGGVAVAVAAHHLADLDPLGVPRERRGDGPGLEGGFHRRFWRGVEMVVDPDRVPRPGVRGFCDRRHRLKLLDRVPDLHQIHPPALRHEHPEPDCHPGSSSRCAPSVSSGGAEARTVPEEQGASVVEARAKAPRRDGGGATATGPRRQRGPDTLAKDPVPAWS